MSLDLSLPGSELMLRDGAQAAAVQETIWKLAAEEELRLEIEAKTVEQKCTVQLLSGTAELFGTELMVDREYTFSPASAASSSSSASGSSGGSGAVDDGSSTLRFAIFSWHGCELRIRGTPKTAYKKSDTPMISYINAHAALDNMRELTRNKQRHTGPRTMVIGAPDTGKSTLCRILLSYAVRAGSKPLFVDLDVSCSAISVPGTLSATSIEHPISVEMSADMGGGGGSAHTLSIKSPLAYFYGHTSPTAAPELYTKLMGRLASVVERRMAEHPLTNSSGLLINTSSTVDSTPGTPTYELVIQTAHAFGVDVIFVLDRDDLTQALKNDKRLQADVSSGGASAGGLRSGVSVAQLSKSGGVASRDALARKKAQSRALREYFYGSPGLDFVPHQKVLAWKEVELYRVGGGPAMPSSVMPLGAAKKAAAAAADPTKLTRITPSLDLQHAILALSYTKDAAGLLDANVAGFVHVAGVDVIKKTITLLTPAPGPLPNNIFLAGHIKWID